MQGQLVEQVQQDHVVNQAYQDQLVQEVSLVSEENLEHLELTDVQVKEDCPGSQVALVLLDQKVQEGNQG